jgi:cytochrome c biogenesis protein CcdA
MTVTSAKGLLLPAVFGFGTAIPVILFTYLLAFAANSIGSFYGKIQKIEKVMRYITALVFIVVGVYYVLLFLELL